MAAFRGESVGAPCRKYTSSKPVTNPSMNASDAEITEIPVLTKTEAIDHDLDTMKDIFSGDDISGLDLEFRRHRKLQVNSIEEYLNTLEFKPQEDGDQDEPCNDSSKGLFKKNYKMKILEEADELSPTRHSAKSAFKNQTSSVSTKSNFKKADEAGIRLAFFGGDAGQKNALQLFLASSTPLIAAATKREGQLAFNEKACQAKVFTTKQKITRVDEEEKSLSFSASMHDLQGSPERLSLKGGNPQQDPPAAFEFSNIYPTYLSGTCDSYLLPGISPAAGAHQVYSILVEDQEIVLLEFGADEELEGQRDLIAIHVCYKDDRLDRPTSSTLLKRVESATRQDGYCSMRRFVSKLLDVPMPAQSGSIRQIEERDLEVKSLHLEEVSSKLLEMGEEDSRRKQSNSTGRKNSAADILEDQFFEEDSEYFQTLIREKIYHGEGSFSL